MATVDLPVVHVDDAPITGRARHNGEPRRWHRISTVRSQQGISLRSAARRMKMDTATVRAQDDELADLRLSDLYRWQEALEVPIADLLVDPDTPLSRPVLERAHLLRVMKTVLAIRDQTKSTAMRRLAQTMVDQLIELMPELEHVTPWHTVGQRRSMDEVGRIAECPIPDFLSATSADFHDE